MFLHELAAAALLSLMSLWSVVQRVPAAPVLVGLVAALALAAGLVLALVRQRRRRSRPDILITDVVDEDEEEATLRADRVAMHRWPLLGNGGRGSPCASESVRASSFGSFVPRFTFDHELTPSQQD